MTSTAVSSACRASTPPAPLAPDSGYRAPITISFDCWARAQADTAARDAAPPIRTSRRLIFMTIPLFVPRAQPVARSGGRSPACGLDRLRRSERPHRDDRRPQKVRRADRRHRSGTSARSRLGVLLAEPQEISRQVFGENREISLHVARREARCRTGKVPASTGQADCNAGRKGHGVWRILSHRTGPSTREWWHTGAGAMFRFPANSGDGRRWSATAIGSRGVKAT